MATKFTSKTGIRLTRGKSFVPNVSELIASYSASSSAVSPEITKQLIPAIIAYKTSSNLLLEQLQYDLTVYTKLVNTKPTLADTDPTLYILAIQVHTNFNEMDRLATLAEHNNSACTFQSMNMIESILRDDNIIRRTHWK